MSPPQPTTNTPDGRIPLAGPYWIVVSILCVAAAGGASAAYFGTFAIPDFALGGVLLVLVSLLLVAALPPFERVWIEHGVLFFRPIGRKPRAVPISEIHDIEPSPFARWFPPEIGAVTLVLDPAEADNGPLRVDLPLARGTCEDWLDRLGLEPESNNV